MQQTSIPFFISMFLLLSPILAVPDHNAVLGDWDCEAYVDGQVYPVTFSFRENDGVLAGSASSEMGTTELESPKYSEGKLTFKVYVGEAGTIDFDLEVDGTALKGTLGSYSIQGTISGTKK